MVNSEWEHVKRKMHPCGCPTWQDRDKRIHMLIFQSKETQTSLRWVTPNLARCKEWVGEPDDKPLKIFQRCILIGGRSGLESAGLVDNDQVGSKLHKHEHPLAMLGENAHQWNSAPSSRLTAPHIFSRGRGMQCTFVNVYYEAQQSIKEGINIKQDFILSSWCQVNYVHLLRLMTNINQILIISCNIRWILGLTSE